MIGQASDTAAGSGAAALDGGWPAVEVSSNGTITSANDAFARCVGRTVAELRGASFFDIVHADDRRRAEALVADPVAPPVELRLVDASGGERLLLIGPLHATSRILLCCDLTQRRQMEQAARDAEATAREDARRYGELIRGASDWVWETDAELRYTYFSANLEKLTSITPETIIGKRRDEIADASLEPEKWAAHLATIRSRKPFRDFVYSQRRPMADFYGSRSAARRSSPRTGSSTGTAVSPRMSPRNALPSRPSRKASAACASCSKSRATGSGTRMPKAGSPSSRRHGARSPAKTPPNSSAGDARSSATAPTIPKRGANTWRSWRRANRSAILPIACAAPRAHRAGSERPVCRFLTEPSSRAIAAPPST